MRAIAKEPCSLGFTSADKAVLTDLWGAELLLPVWRPAHTPSEEIKCNSLLSYILQPKKIAQPNASSPESSGS